MDSVLSSFHFDIVTFSELLNATGAVVAGSAALAAYIPNKFTPNDLDIWVHSDFFPPSLNGLAPPDHPGVSVRLGYNYLFAYFMKHHGYVEVDRPVQRDVEYTSNPVFAILRSIQRFQHPSGQIVQVMHCKVPVDNILDSFDLSVAKTWWYPSCNPKQFPLGTLYTEHPESCKAGHMYSLREPVTDREKARIEKYESRGFKWVRRST
jgi:hypothetical protein